MADLVFADRNEERSAFFAVDDDVGGLQARIAEESVGVEIFVCDVFEGFFVGGDALEPTERRDHREQQVKFGVFGDQRLLEDDGFLRIEAGGQVVGDDFDRVLGDLRRVGVIAGERVPVGDEVEAVVFGIVLEANPVLQRAEIVADVQACRWDACR